MVKPSILLSYLCVLRVFAPWRDALSSQPIEYHGHAIDRGIRSFTVEARGDFKTLSQAPVIRAKSSQKTCAVQAPRLRCGLMFIFVP